MAISFDCATLNRFVPIITIHLTKPHNHEQILMCEIC